MPHVGGIRGGLGLLDSCLETVEVEVVDLGDQEGPEIHVFVHPVLNNVANVHSGAILLEDVVATLADHRLNLWQNICPQVLQVLVPPQSACLVEQDGVHLGPVQCNDTHHHDRGGHHRVLRRDVIIIKHGDEVILMIVGRVDGEVFLIGDA